MIFDSFKKTFFPHLHQTYNISEVLKTNEGPEIDPNISNRKLTQPEFLKERLMKLDQFLKDKFAKFWVSVRKAFLDLDADHDGYISVEDIMRYFGTENDFNY